MLSNRNNNIIIIKNILAFLLLLLSVLFTIIHDVDYPFYLLTFAYLIVSNFCPNNCMVFGKLPGQTVINIVLFIRYCFVPFVLCMDGTLSIYADNYRYIDEAIFLMIYELVVVFIVLELSALRQKTKFLLDNNAPKVKTFRVRKISTMFVIIVIVCLFIFNKGELLNFSLLNKNNSGSEKFENVSNLEMILWEVLLTWLFVTIINHQKNIYDKNKKLKHVIFSVGAGVVLAVLIFLSQSRISRWYILISCISVLWVLIRFYPAKKKLVMVVLILPIILLTFATITKNGSGVEGGFVSQIKDLLNSTIFDTYFAGPVSVNNAIGLIQECNVNIKSFVFDLLNNFPVINKYIDFHNSSVYLYNLYIGRIFGSGGGDQIIPLLGQSSVYFSYLLSPMLSALSVAILCYSDRKFYVANGCMCYVWAFTSTWFGMATILNMTIISSWVYVRILPMLFVFMSLDRRTVKD